MIQLLALKSRFVFLASAILLSSPAFLAQQPTIKTPTFDVVSIKPNKSASGSMMWGWGDNGYNATNLGMMMILADAYALRVDQISGAPGWAKSTNFDVNAKILDLPPDTLDKLTDHQRSSMLQTILADRCQLKAHIETKVLPVYELVLAKGGTKLKALPPVPIPADGSTPESRGSWTSSSGKFTATAISVTALISNLEQQLQRTVIDKTGLAGVYDLKLTWTPDGQQNPDAESAAPSLFTAVQEQLGLRLQPSKGPVDTLVIDHMELPSEN